MTVTAELLRSLEVISFETHRGIDVLRDADRGSISDRDAREVRARLEAIAEGAKALIEWLSTARLESREN